MNIGKHLSSVVMLLVVMSLLLSACASAAPAPTQPTTTPTRMPPVSPTPRSLIPEFINHPVPNLKVDFTPFENAGCPGAAHDARYCTKTSPLYALGCDLIVPPSDLWGGLSPAYPLAVCISEPWLHWGEPGKETWEQVYGSQDYMALIIGGTSFSPVRYVVYRDQQFQLIKTAPELAPLYAPITSPNEALSYALAMDYYTRAEYNLKYNPHYTYLVPTLEDTNVLTVPGGYLLNLYWDGSGSCEPYFAREGVLLVSTEGVITGISWTKVYTSTDVICY